MPVRGFRRSIFETGFDESIKCTVVLFESQVYFLDHIAVDIRLRHGAVLLRAEIVYALIEAAIRSGIDLSEAASQNEITMLMLQQWSRKSGRKQRRHASPRTEKSVARMSRKQ